MKTFTLGNSNSQVLEMIYEKAIHKINLDDKTIALVRSGELFHAFQANCPHRGTSLFEGSLTKEGEIICPLHEYRFDMKTGEVKIGSCGNLEIYRTELTENGLKIYISAK
ncbi:Rieske (2Fe-2S) protein [Algoriphagus aquimarinus]|uniref:Nitrite reductase (NADH) small subunit n=1 Tax=Algoriphagus aquimarinus TaxID=237018 RepID=A0A1I1BF96_9BACT|nr:Rieske 2Fe-2S domain-containing protein [Algoriphagus aquimarinus]SFB49024.1 nitrite reductase (NADH) small subunit [Algoriphagus aquimarinus]|tara:strand:+ start:164901 stop:165230 length:330 start_codon:yes stop_codon:yes gene_type:complete